MTKISPKHVMLFLVKLILQMIVINTYNLLADKKVDGHNVIAYFFESLLLSDALT